MNILVHTKKHRLVFIVFLTIIIGSVLWYMRSRSPETLLAKVGKHILLPTNEIPAIATVSDENKIKNQQFFSDAEKGDILLIYNSSQKAILYRPSIDNIINVTTINIHAAAPIQPATPTSSAVDIKTASITIAIYNGTQIAGLASKIENQLKQDMPNVKVVTKSNTKGDYTDNLVINVSGKNKVEADAVAKLINGTVGSLPQDEQKPAADILIIVGKDI